MYKEQEATVKNVIDYFQKQESVIAVLLGGSIAHGYATEASDVDIMILVSNEEYSERLKKSEQLFYNKELSTYKEGYVDGKYICNKYLDEILEKGNEIVRYAFEGSKILFSKDKLLQEKINKIVQFDVSKKEEHNKSFYSQVLSWDWYLNEGLRHKNKFLIDLAVNNFYLFTCRLILNDNERLYPYYKWMIKEVERSKNKPANLLQKLDKLLETKSPSLTKEIIEDLKSMHSWGIEDWEWSKYYYNDVESVWMRQTPAVTDW